MRSDIVPGGIFPDYELPDHTGKLRKLSELQGDDPLSSASRIRTFLPVSVFREFYVIPLDDSSFELARP